MTFSSLIGSLTGAKTDPAEPHPAGTPASSPDVLGWLQAGALQIVPREEDRSLGALREVRERIADVLPGVVFDDEGRGSFARTGYTVSFDTGAEEQVEAVRVAVTGGAAALPPLQRLVTKTGWRLESAH